MVIKCIRARTYGKYITLIKAGTISKFFFQKLSDFRQLTKTEDACLYIKKKYTVISGKEGYGISLVRTESSVKTKEQFVLIYLN
jgi:hypothetical protein